MRVPQPHPRPVHARLPTQSSIVLCTHGSLLPLFFSPPLSPSPCHIPALSPWAMAIPSGALCDPVTLCSSLPPVVPTARACACQLWVSWDLRTKWMAFPFLECGLPGEGTVGQVLEPRALGGGGDSREDTEAGASRLTIRPLSPYVLSLQRFSHTHPPCPPTASHTLLSPMLQTLGHELFPWGFFSGHTFSNFSTLQMYLILGLCSDTISLASAFLITLGGQNCSLWLPLSLHVFAAGLVPAGHTPHTHIIRHSED